MSGVGDTRGVDQVLAGVLAGEDRDQARAVLGGAAAEGLAAALVARVRRVTGRAPIACRRAHVSVGVVLELALDGGGACVVKACRPGDDAARRGRRAALRAQARLADAGIPIGRLLDGVAPWGDADAWILAWVDPEEPVRFDASVRDALAVGLARLVRAANPPGVPVDRDLPSGLPVHGGLWPAAHSVIFDLDGTAHAPAARRIDAIAAPARAHLAACAAACDAGTLTEVVGHGDWARQNVALRGGAVVGIFDADSLIRAPEPVIVAAAAAFHPHDWRLGEADPDYDRYYPGVDETMAFVDAYGAERGVRFVGADAAILRAALVYRLAYQARCAVSLAPDAVPPAAERLWAFAAAFDVR